jgi:hypothetical protein
MSVSKTNCHLKPVIYRVLWFVAASLLTLMMHKIYNYAEFFKLIVKIYFKRILNICF